MTKCCGVSSDAPGGTGAGGVLGTGISAKSVISISPGCSGGALATRGGALAWGRPTGCAWKFQVANAAPGPRQHGQWGWLPIAGSMYDILVPTRNMKHMVTGEPQHMLAMREFRDTDAACTGITVIVHRFRGIQGGLAARHWRRKGSGHSSCCCCPGSHCFCRLCFSGTPRGESRHHEINHGIHIGRNDGARIVAWSRVRTLGRWSTGNERM